MSANLAAILSEAAERSPSGVGLVFDGNDVTFEQLEVGARRAATGLAALGVARGDRVGLWMGNHPSFVAAMYGAWRIGAVVVPLHAMLTAPEAKHILSDAGTKVVVCGDVQFGVLSDAEGRVTHDTLREAGSDDVLPLADVADDELALLGYTSGTSGLPKGAMLTAGNLRANLVQMKESPVGVREGDVVLCVLPLFHIFGLNVVLNLAMHAGATVVLFERFDAPSSIRAIGERGVTVVAAAPPAYVAWLAVPDVGADAFSSVRVAVSGAAPLQPDVLASFEQRFGVTIWEGYGLTETSPALTFTAVGGVAKPGSIGRPLPRVELRVIDEDGADVEPGDPGEIVVRGPNVFAGYWNQPDQTADAFLDGWFRTGDIAVTDQDGDLYIVDRRKDLILVSGFNVYPREVEDVLRRHPHVGDCAVVGVPDAEHGEAVRALVVSDPPGEDVALDELLEFCRGRLAPYKLPSRIDVVREIPRNAAGKVLRRVLRD